jgi:hypothetical protein
MRTRVLALLAGPLLLLATACADQLVTPPHEVMQHHRPGHGDDGGGEAASYRAILLADRDGFANAINDAGIVVGNIQAVAVRWVVSSGGIAGPEELGTLPGRYADSWQYALDVNGSGVIVGYATSRSHGTDGAFVYTDELGMQLLRGIPDATYRRRAVAVNDQGIIAGWIDFVVRDDDGVITDQRIRGAVWLNTDDEPMLLPPLEDHEASRAVAININGLITGYSRPAGDSQAGEVGVAWRINDEGQLVEGPYPLNAGFQPGSWRPAWTWPDYGKSVNEAGDMVGWSSSGAIREAALMRSGSVLLLGSLVPDDGSFAAAMIDAGVDGVVQIVGQSGQVGSLATLWTVDADGKVEAVDLGAPARSINASAAGINAQGWIAGRSASRTLSRRPTLWLPQESGETCDPHPKTGACR